MSMSCVEAAACGLPVVAYDVPGLRDTVLNGVTGFLTHQNPEEMARAIERLIVDQNARRAMGAAGRQRVLAVNSRSTWMREHMIAYGEGAWRPTSDRSQR
jgi:glycosyltransferase involved in cell wall biosynthesis